MWLKIIFARFQWRIRNSALAWGIASTGVQVFNPSNLDQNEKEKGGANTLLGWCNILFIPPENMYIKMDRTCIIMTMLITDANTRVSGRAYEGWFAVENGRSEQTTVEIIWNWINISLWKLLPRKERPLEHCESRAALVFSSRSCWPPFDLSSFGPFGPSYAWVFVAQRSAMAAPSLPKPLRVGHH